MNDYEYFESPSETEEREATLAGNDFEIMSGAVYIAIQDEIAEEIAEEKFNLDSEHPRYMFEKY